MKTLLALAILIGGSFWAHAAQHSTPATSNVGNAEYPDLFSAAGSWAAAIGFRRPGAAEEFSAQPRQNAERIKDRVRLLLIVGDQDMTCAGHGPFIAQRKELKLAHDYQVLAGVGHDLGRYQRDTGSQLVEFLGQSFREIQNR
jgi:hypothetical protein